MLAGNASSDVPEPGVAGAAALGARVWLDPSRSVSDRVEALLRAMTTDQKVRNLGSDATTGGVRELGVPPFVWQASRAGWGDVTVLVSPQQAQRIREQSPCLSSAKGRIRRQVHMLALMQRGPTPACRHKLAPSAPRCLASRSTSACTAW